MSTAFTGEGKTDAKDAYVIAETLRLPAGSLTGDLLYVTDPPVNDYYTRPGSPARDAASPVAAAVGDPRRYCDDPSPSETDTLVEPDIGSLESCT